MISKETHEWAKQKMGQWKELTQETSRISSSADKKVASTQKGSFKTDSFFGDISSRDGDLFFHFFPTPNSRYNLCAEHGEVVWIFSSNFVEGLTQAFLSVFKFEERLFLDFVPELQSYVVRCSGFGDNPLQDTMIENVLIKLKEMYEKC